MAVLVEVLLVGVAEILHIIGKARKVVVEGSDEAGVKEIGNLVARSGNLAFESDEGSVDIFLAINAAKFVLIAIDDVFVFLLILSVYHAGSHSLVVFVAEVLNLAVEFRPFEGVGETVQLLCMILANIQFGFENSAVAVYRTVDSAGIDGCNDAIERVLVRFDIGIGDDVCIGIFTGVIDNVLYAIDNTLQFTVGGFAVNLVAHLVQEFFETVVLHEQFILIHCSLETFVAEHVVLNHGLVTDFDESALSADVLVVGIYVALQVVGVVALGNRNRNIFQLLACFFVVNPEFSLNHAVLLLCECLAFVENGRSDAADFGEESVGKFYGKFAIVVFEPVSACLDIVLFVGESVYLHLVVIASDGGFGNVYSLFGSVEGIFEELLGRSVERVGSAVVDVVDVGGIFFGFLAEIFVEVEDSGCARTFCR